MFTKFFSNYRFTNRQKGALYILFACLMATIYSGFCKLALQTTPFITVGFCAFAVGLFVQILVVRNEPPSFFYSKKIPLHIARAVFGISASLLFFLSLRYIPLIDGILLFNTTPLFIPILSIVVLKIYPSPRVWFSIALGFVGLVVLIRPSMSSLDDPGSLIGLASGLCLAFAYLFIKILTRNEPLKRIIFYFYLFATILQIPFLIAFGSIPTLTVLLYCTIGGVAGAIGQFALVKAYQCAEMADLGPLQYSSVIFAGIIDWIFWNKIPSFLDMLGVLIVVIAGILIFKKSPE